MDGDLRGVPVDIAQHDDLLHLRLNTSEHGSKPFEAALIDERRHDDQSRSRGLAHAEKGFRRGDVAPRTPR